MFKDTKAFSGFSVNDLGEAKKFYSTVLGLNVEESGPGLMLNIPGTNGILVYPKPDHIPAAYTMLNFPVEDIDHAVDEMKAKGLEPITYEGTTDAKGIARGLAAKRGPDIAWFKDPAGNIFSVLQQD